MKSPAGIIGVLVLAMYGDRTPYYQDPYSYKSSHSKLTPLGEAQELQLGAYLRSQYLTSGGPAFIKGLSTDLVDDRQIYVRADNGGEKGVIVDSAIALLQGLYPPTPRSRTYLANGTTVVGPFGGYQYIPIESVEPDQSIQLEGWTQCPKFEKHIKAFYDSPEFKAKAKQVAPFLDELKQFLFGIPNNLENIWNIYDYMSTNYVHNETYAFRLPPSFLAQAQALADWHEHGIFTDKAYNGIGNVAGRSILPAIIKSLERLADEQDPLHFALQELSYKPFMSLFNLTAIDERYPDLRGIPNYASALSLEVWLDDEGEAFLRTKFKNGTVDEGFRTVNLFGHKGDIALNEFLYRLDLAAIRDVPQWCKECGQTTARGCSVCNTDFAPPSWPSSGHSRFTSISSDEGKSGIAWGELFNQLWDNYHFAAISAVVFAVVFGMIKFARSRRPRLEGYDPLPTGTQPYRDYDSGSAGKKQRF